MIHWCQVVLLEVIQKLFEREKSIKTLAHFFMCKDFHQFINAFHLLTVNTTLIKWYTFYWFKFNEWIFLFIRLHPLYNILWKQILLLNHNANSATISWSNRTVQIKFKYTLQYFLFNLCSLWNFFDVQILMLFFF